MTEIPLIRVNGLHGVIAFLQQLNAPLDRLLTEAKLSPLILYEPEALIPLKQALQLIETAATHEGIAQFGLFAGQQTQIAKLGAFGRLLCHSLTLYDAIQTLIHLVHSYNSGDRVWLEHQEGKVWLCRRFTYKLEAEHPQAVHCSLIIMIHLVQLATGTQWQPTEIHLTTNPVQRIHQIKLLSNAEIQFNQDKTAIAIPVNLLSLPLKSNFDYNQYQRELDYSFLKSSDPRTNVLDSLKHMIKNQLKHGYPSIESIAEILGISVRTFQRQLSYENLTYSHLIDQVRFERSLMLLNDPLNKVADIAAEIGYKDAGNFTRAFKRWTGVSPKVYSTHHLHIHNSGRRVNAHDSS